MKSSLYSIPTRYDVYLHEGVLSLSDDITKDGVHQISTGSNKIDVLLQGMSKRKEHDNTALICFSGAVSNRSLKKAPFFSGTNIARNLDVPLIAIADPTISDYDLNLAWYGGNIGFVAFQTELARLIEELSNKLSLDKVIMFGGSGGGFACLVQAKLVRNLNCKVFVWNPQTSITKYYLAHVGNYLKIAFPQLMKDIMSDLKRIDVERAYKQILDTSGIVNSLKINELSSDVELIYLQNYSDEHTELHLLPFMNLKENSLKRNGDSEFSIDSYKANFYIGNWGQGHAVPPNEYINFVLKGLLDDQPGQQIIQDMLQSNLITYDIAQFVAFELEESSFAIQVSIYNSLCKVQIELIETIRNFSFDFAYSLKSGNKTIGYHHYSNRDSCIFDIFSFDLNKLCIGVSLRMSDGREVTKEVPLNSIDIKYL